MALEGQLSGAQTTLGAQLNPADASLTLQDATSFPTSGKVRLVITDNEIVHGDISGATVSGLTHAAEKYKGVQTAFTHSAGDAVWLAITPASEKNMFVQKVDERVASIAVASFVFSPVDAGGRNLKLKCSLRGDTAAATVKIWVRLNGDAGSLYMWVQVVETQLGATATDQGAGLVAQAQMGLAPGASAPANCFAGFDLDLYDYATPSTPKFQMASRSSYQKAAVAAGSMEQTRNSGNYTPALLATITSITILPDSGNWGAGSKATLYTEP